MKVEIEVTDKDANKISKYLVKRVMCVSTGFDAVRFSDKFMALIHEQLEKSKSKES